eukprot:311417_1
MNSSKKPVSVESWLDFNKSTVADVKCNLSDAKKEILTMGYIRIKAENKVKCPLDVVRLLIQYMFIDYHKPHLSLCVVGHVDSGKSTLCGRLLYDLGFLSDHELETQRKQCFEIGKESFKFAHIFDSHLVEKHRGISIDYHVKHFYSNYFHYTLIDAPGHRDYIHNMIYATAAADIAILMIPANKHDFEYSLQKANYKLDRREGNSRQHATICHVLGIRQLIVCINKMDHKSVNYSETRFNEVKDAVRKMLSKIGYKTKKIPFIPISAWNGENVVKPSNHMDWYQGFNVKIKKTLMNGHTLLDALDHVVKLPRRAVRKPFVCPISKRYLIKVKINDTDMKRILRVMSLETHHKAIKEAAAGDRIGIVLSGLNIHSFIEHIRTFAHDGQRGDVICVSTKLRQNLPKMVKSFTAMVWVQRHPGRLKVAKWGKARRRIKERKIIHKEVSYGRVSVQRSIPVFENAMGYKGGYAPTVYVQHNRSPATITKILWKRGRATNQQKIEHCEYLEKGDEALIQFTLQKQLIVAPFDECKRFGRIIALDHCNVIMFGKVMSVSHT